MCVGFITWRAPRDLMPALTVPLSLGPLPPVLPFLILSVLGPSIHLLLFDVALNSLTTYMSKGFRYHKHTNVCRTRFLRTFPFRISAYSVNYKFTCTISVNFQHYQTTTRNGHVSRRGSSTYRALVREILLQVLSMYRRQMRVTSDHIKKQQQYIHIFI